MVRSDIQILREEIRRITTEFDEFKDKSAKLEKAMTERILQLTLENDLETADCRKQQKVCDA